MIKQVPLCGRAGSQSDSMRDSEQQLLGVLCVYVDDFLMMAPAGPVRNAMVQALRALWEFGPERTLTTETSITFLGIDWYLRENGDIFLTQERFTRELLLKHKMSACRPVKNITIDKPSEVEDVPSHACMHACML